MSDPGIEIVMGGPMLVRGLELRRIAALELGPDLAPGETYAVCRCGRSSSMPLCEREAPYGCFEEEAPARELEKLPTWDVPDPAIDRSWCETARLRLEELRSGRVKPIPGNEVFSRITERFAQ